jgi:hypothetical protein
MTEFIIEDNIRIPKNNSQQFTDAIDNVKKIENEIGQFFPKHSEVLNSYEDDWDFFHTINSK